MGEESIRVLNRKRVDVGESDCIRRECKGRSRLIREE
jgi:hypothetical protein